MTATYRFTGDTINFPNNADVDAGTLVVKGALVGMTKFPTPAGEPLVLSTRGIFEGVPKATGALAEGQIVYAKADGKIYGTSSAGAIPCGYAAKTALAADTTCTIFLTPTGSPAATA